MLVESKTVLQWGKKKLKSGLFLPDCLRGLSRTRMCYFPRVRLVVTYLKELDW